MNGLRVELELDDGSFTSRFIHAGQTVARFEKSVNAGIVSISRAEKASEGLLSTLRDLTVTLAVAGHALHNLNTVTTGWAGEIIRVNAEFERMRVLMTSLSTAADPVKDATATVTALREQAKNAPFSLQAMHDAFVRMKSAGIDPMNGSLKAVTDAVAAFGGNDQTLHSASLALQEMAGKGVIQMKELRNQLGMAIPNAIPLLARALGVSYQELMSDIHTGTVDAKEAIKALTLEFDRAFGGAGLAQMQTFNGQLARMKVNLQNLAIEHVGGGPGGGGYFDAVKSQVMDFNSFLEGSTAAGLGKMLGNGLTEVVLDLRKILDVAVRFRSEIGAAVEVLAVAFGAKIVWAGLTALGTQIAAVTTEATLLGVAWNTMTGKMQAATLLNSTIMMGAPMISGLTASWRTAGAALQFFSVGVSTVLPWLAILGPAVAMVAEHFGVFTNKTNEAYQSLERFGAKTIEEADKAKGYLIQYDARIAALKALKKAYEETHGTEGPSFGREGREYERNKKELEDLERRRQSVVGNVVGFHMQGAEAEAKTFVDAQIRELSKMVARSEAIYNESSVKEEDRYSAQVKAYAAAHKSREKIDADHQKTRSELVMAEYAQQEAYIRKVIDTAKELQKSTDEVKHQEGVDLAATAYKLLNDLQQKRMTEEQRPKGVSLNTKLVDESKLYEKGVEELQKLRDQAEGFRAGIEGLDPKVHQLMSHLSHGGKFGDIGVERVKELIANLVKAKEEADILNEAMKGQQKLDGEVRALRESLDERMFRAQYGNLPETEQLAMKIRNGFFAGVGPNRGGVDKVLAEIEARAREAVQATQGLGDALGGPVKTQAELVLDVFKSMAGVLNQVGVLAGGVSLPKPPGATGAFGLGGPVGSGDFFDRLIKRESGGRADAGLSNHPDGAIGLGQFMPATWNAFLTARHPELYGRQDLRTDPALSREAIAWYTAQNASGLQGRGLDPNDANLYMSHLLGLGGASRVLSGDTSTRFANDPYFSKAVAGNPFLSGMTYGGLVDQLRGQFGAGYTGVGGVPASIDGLTPKQRETLYDPAKPSEAEVIKAETLAKLREEVKKLGEDTIKASIQIDEGRRHYAALVAQIKTGTFVKSGIGSTDPNDPIYKSALDAAAKADAAEKATGDSKKARSKADTALADLQKQIDEGHAEYQQIWATIRGGNKFGSSSEMLRAKAADETALKSVRDGYGDGSDEYGKASSLVAAKEQELRNREIAKDIAGLDKKTATLRESLMTQDQAQENAYNREVERLNKELAAFTGTEEEKKAIAQKAADYIAAMRASQEAKTPLAREFQQWGDLTKNAQQLTASFLSSTVDGFAQLAVKGRTNWRQLTDSMTMDLVKMGLRFGMSGIGNGLKGAASGAGGAMKGASAGGGSFMGNLFTSFFGSAAGGGGAGGIGHNATGTNNFPGGFTWVGEKGPELTWLPSGTNIMPAGTVPTMARQGSGSTSAAMQSATIVGGATNMITIAPVINASGGTPQANADLAQQVGRHVEEATNLAIADAMRKQMRPGGLLDGTKFNGSS